MCVVHVRSVVVELSGRVVAVSYNRGVLKPLKSSLGLNG